jgi:hypothetical protein
MGQLLFKVKRWTNLEVTDPKVEKVLEEEGPKLLGYPTSHIRLVTTAGIKASVVVKKFRFHLQITDDVWIATQLEIHPIVQQWRRRQRRCSWVPLNSFHLEMALFPTSFVLRGFTFSTYE